MQLSQLGPPGRFFPSSGVVGSASTDLQPLLCLGLARLALCLEMAGWTDAKAHPRSHKTAGRCHSYATWIGHVLFLGVSSLVSKSGVALHQWGTIRTGADLADLTKARTLGRCWSDLGSCGVFSQGWC